MIKTHPIYKLILPLSFLLFFASTVPHNNPSAPTMPTSLPKGSFTSSSATNLIWFKNLRFPVSNRTPQTFEVDYGLFEHVELGVAAPLITIFNAAGTSPKTVMGIGDMNISVKYNFRPERENSVYPQ